MQWIFYVVLFSSILWKVPFNEYVPLSTIAFHSFVRVLRNETLEIIGVNYDSFQKFLKDERDKYGKD